MAITRRVSAGPVVQARASEVAVADIRMAPEDELEQDGLDPGLVHNLDVIGRGPTVGQKWFQRL